MVNEYEHPASEIFPYYLRSYLFSNNEEARKFIKIRKRDNTKIGGCYKYEMEIEMLHISAEDVK